ncbi:MAG: hypothetical protein HYW47_02690 [Deltaproteobacteria bacterium]|nr:hypothetical protein [Deltaproteobacteria bacterium]
MAKLEVETENITDLLKKRLEKAKGVLMLLEGFLPTSKDLEPLKKTSEKILHCLGVPTVSDIEKLNKKIDKLSSKKDKS